MGCCNRVGSAPNPCPRLIATSDGSVTSCTTFAGGYPSGGWLLSQQTGPAARPSTGNSFPLPVLHARSLVRKTPSPLSWTGLPKQRNTNPVGCRSSRGTDAAALLSRSAAFRILGSVVGIGGASWVVPTRRGPTSATRGPSRARSERRWLTPAGVFATGGAACASRRRRRSASGRPG
jgi:hypothetical protein